MQVRREGEVEVLINTDTKTVYKLISDVTRTGEWSPECRRCQWLDNDQRAAVGARFRGWNRSGLVRWSRLVEVVSADPSREFTFRTLTDRFNKDSTTWRYTLECEDGQTRLRHSYEIHALPKFPVSWIMPLLLRHHADMRPQMAETVERIKTVAEAEVAAG